MKASLEKKTPPHYAIPQSCLPYHIDEMAGGQLIEKQKATSYSEQWREQLLCAYLMWANDHSQVACMPPMGKLQRVAVVQIPMVESPQVTMASSMAPESRKHTPEQTPKI